MEISVGEIALAVGGTVVQGFPGAPVTGVCIDSREIKPGEWFVPLEGEQTDGHYFIADAFHKGAAGAFVSRDIDTVGLREAALVKVKDTLKALQDLARYYRGKFQVDVVGITGSSGKTTTKDFMASVLSQQYRVLKTEGNLNNEIGLPLMLLRLEEHHQVAVLEMGMSARGEIELLTRISSPSCGVITNIGDAHLEILGSREEIARAKTELLKNLPEESTALINGDDPLLLEHSRGFGGKLYLYGWDKYNHFQVKRALINRQDSHFEVAFPGSAGREEFSIPLPGRHNVANALASLSVGYLMGMTPELMREGLKNSELTWGRLEIKEGKQPGVKIIDDSYNANPDSVKASLEVAKELSPPEKMILVLGDMLELGEVSESRHREIGQIVGEMAPRNLLTVGSWSEYIKEEASLRGVPACHFRDAHDAWEYLCNLYLEEGTFILLKGSRGIKLDEIVRKMTK